MPPKVPKPLATQPTTLNLPPFREDQPAMWFTLAEGQFEMKGMQDRRYWFYIVFTALSAQKQDRVVDIAGLTPVPAQYNASGVTHTQENPTPSRCHLHCRRVPTPRCHQHRGNT